MKTRIRIDDIRLEQRFAIVNELFDSSYQQTHTSTKRSQRLIWLRNRTLSICWRTSSILERKQIVTTSFLISSWNILMTVKRICKQGKVLQLRWNVIWHYDSSHQFQLISFTFVSALSLRQESMSDQVLYSCDWYHETRLRLLFAESYARLYR